MSFLSDCMSVYSFVSLFAKVIKSMFLKIYLILSNSANPYEMLSSAIVHLSLRCLFFLSPFVGVPPRKL